ncbi:hypothetical protein RHMOL_Rhmol06G0170200 [Rhododendron molle]|uniref:Uncharacterized protein n=1 Tax=Rhododendron molle TaxID=49168 RepID=A0ACC0NDC1_RHOML|nr:hypothetical protein RHMOL_Rhmol06G0170200 [Rhododendron molle]
MYDSQTSTYINFPQLVWSANRDHPVKVNATLKFTGHGNLILEDADGDVVWSTNTGGKSVTGLRFTEVGNLVLFDRYNATVWQSFDHPTDCLLLGQKLVTGQKLIASKSSSDFSRGLFSLSVDVFLVGRMEPDGHLKVYEWGGFELRTVADLLTPTVGECGYPMACGKYGICSSNGQCGCFEGSSNVTGKFKQISYKQPNLGCSLVTPISCNYSQDHSLLELKNIGYFNLRYNDNQLDEKTGLEDCKSACLRNCSCKAALFFYAPSKGFIFLDEYTPWRGCLLLFEVFSFINQERGPNINSVFLKVQNSPIKPSSLPIDFPRKISRRGTIVLGSSLGALLGVCLLVGSCIFLHKNKREQEELADEFSIDKVAGMPTRFSYFDLRTATNVLTKSLEKEDSGQSFKGR